MTRGSQSPLHEGQELIGILDTDDDDLLAEEDEPDDETVAAHSDVPAIAPWDQLIAAVDREFLPYDAASAWTAPRFRTK